MTGNQVAALNYQENKRANFVREGIDREKNRETERTNRAKEAETNRSNLVKEAETERTNKANETIKAVKLGADYMKGVGSILNPIF